MSKKEYKKYLELREISKDNKWEPGYGKCYCGHTSYCECSDPDYILFLESKGRGII